MCEIAINASSGQGRWEGYFEIEISSTVAGFSSLPSYLTEVSTAVFPLKHKPNIHYPVAISQVSLELVGQSDGVITAQINSAEFKVSGDSQAFQKLADFLESLSNLCPGEHFHLDWFANEDLLAPATSNMSFIFMMEM